MAFATRRPTAWSLGSPPDAPVLQLGTRTLIMGIVNLTPDSFSGDGTHAPDKTDHPASSDPARFRDQGLARALDQLDQGADILDLGAESTRPGSHAAGPLALSAEEEQQRLLPVLTALRHERPSAILSVDTYRASTAAAALAAGAHIINDVSGLLWDPDMAGTLARAHCGVILMHTRGRPDDWRALRPIEPASLAPLVLRELAQRLAQAEASGIDRSRIVLDPGYGFGKAFQANYTLLADQPSLLALDRPLLAGVSRKSFLGRTLEAAYDRTELQRDGTPSARDTASLAAQTVAILQGASIVRVHAVRPAVEAASIADALLQFQQ
jgi:dihydropteroate synthase